MMNKKFLYISIALHTVAFALSYIKFGDIFQKKLIDQGYAVFDFVTIGPRSQAPVLSRETSRASKQKSEESSTLPKFRKADEVKQNEDKPKEKQSSPISTEKKNKEEKAIKKEKEKSKSSKQNAKEKTVSSDKVKSDKSLVNLNQKNKTNSEKKSKKQTLNSVLDSALADGDYENSGVNAEEVGETLTATQIDLVRQTIRQCWHFPAGLKSAETLVVDIKMELNPEGYVKKAEVVDKKRFQNDPDFRIAAENAYRAVVDPACNPLPLPKEKYNEWKNLELSFNPLDMLH